MTGTALQMIDMQNMYLSDDRVREVFGWPPIWRLDEVVTACAALSPRPARTAALSSMRVL